MDSASVGILAANVVAAITPFMIDAAGKVIPKATEDIYQVVKDRFMVKPAAMEALSDLEKEPADEDFQASVRVQLKKIMADDQRFADQLSELYQKLEQPEPSQGVTASDGSVAAGRDIRGAVFTGDVKGDVSILIPMATNFLNNIIFAYAAFPNRCPGVFMMAVPTTRKSPMTVSM